MAPSPGPNLAPEVSDLAGPTRSSRLHATAVSRDSGHGLTRAEWALGLGREGDRGPAQEGFGAKQDQWLRL